MKNPLNEISGIISKNRSFVIIAHAKPDGDTVGAQLALFSYLSSLKKKVSLYSKFPVPEVYRFLKGWERIRVTRRIAGKFDAAIILECSGLERAGNILEPSNAKTLINIDHHEGYKLFGDTNWISVESAATCEQLFELLTKGGRGISYDEALALYVGILTDTGSLQQGNVKSRTLRVAASLLEKGIDIEQVKNCIYNNFKINSLRFLGGILQTLTLHHRGRILTLEIRKADYKKYHTTEADVEGVIDYGRKIRGISVCCLFREFPEKGGKEKPGKIKVSFRSDRTINMNEFSNRFGGGGHARAAGCTLEGPLEKAKETILNALDKELKKSV